MKTIGKPPASVDIKQGATVTHLPLVDSRLIGKITEGTILEGKNGNYRILKVHISTDNSVIYKGENSETGEIVAIKEIDLKRYKEYKLAEREYEVGRNFDHKNVVRYADFFVFDGSPIVVSHFVEGKNLAQLKGEKIFSNDEVLGIMNQILDGLEYLHTNFTYPIIHRDLKPENLVMKEDGTVVIVDFGFVFDPVGSLTTSFSIVSRGFTAPEVAEGNSRIVGSWSDIFSVGALYYYLISTGGSGNWKTAQDVRADGVDSYVESKVRVVIEKALELDHKERFSSAKEMKDAINTNPTSIALARTTALEARMQKLEWVRYFPFKAHTEETDHVGPNSMLVTTLSASILAAGAIVLLPGEPAMMGLLGIAVWGLFYSARHWIWRGLTKLAEKRLKLTDGNTEGKIENKHGTIWRAWRRSTRFLVAAYREMFRAAERGDVETVRAQLERGLNPDRTSQGGIFKKYGKTVLEIGLESGNLDIAQVAINYGADVNRTPNCSKYDPLERNNDILPVLKDCPSGNIAQQRNAGFPDVRRIL